MLNMAYKIYAMVLSKRLKEEVERKGLLPETQNGFRKNRSVIDNVYILQHAIEREIIKPKGKLFALFVDISAAFDTVNRKIL